MMATYRITSPTGDTYEINAPDTASEREVLAYAQQQFSAMRPQPAPEQYDPTEGMSTFDKVAAGFGKSIYDTGIGLKQVGMEALNHLPGVDYSSELAQEYKDESERKKRDAALMKTGAGLAGNIAGHIGQGILIPGGASLKGAMAIGALQAGAQAVGEEDSRLENTLIGGAAGGAGNVLARGAARVFNPLKAYVSAPKDPLRAQHVEMVERGLGIDNLSPAQKSGATPLQALEAALAERPFTAGQLQERIAGQQGKFNDFIARQMGQHGEQITPDLRDAAKAAAGQTYQDVAERTTVTLDKDFAKEIFGVHAKYDRLLESQQKPVVQNLFMDLAEKASDPKGLSGAEYQAIRSQLGMMAQGQQGAMKSAVKGFQRALDDAFERSAAPDDVVLKKTADERYRLFKLFEKNAGLIDDKGNVSMKKLATALRRENGKGAVNRTLLDTANAASHVIPNPIPNSGTPVRTLAHGLLNGDISLTGLPAMLTMGARDRAALALMQAEPGAFYLQGGLTQNIPPKLRGLLFNLTQRAPTGGMLAMD